MSAERTQSGHKRKKDHEYSIHILRSPRPVPFDTRNDGMVGQSDYSVEKLISCLRGGEGSLRPTLLDESRTTARCKLAATGEALFRFDYSFSTDEAPIPADSDRTNNKHEAHQSSTLTDAKKVQPSASITRDQSLDLHRIPRTS